MLMKKMKQVLKDNSGFSLTELIIVIAIIAIMTTASFVTISIMHSARAKEAGSTFENALAEVIGMAKSKSVDYDMDGTINSEEQNFTIGLRMYKDGGKFYLKKCVFKKNANGTYSVFDYNSNNAFIKSINEKDGKGACLTAYVNVKYYDEAGTLSTDTQYELVFNKKGECVQGVGRYEFVKSSSGNKIVTVTVNKNGSYIVK